MFLVTPPTTEPVTVDDVKHHLRVDHDADDDYISILIALCRQYVESYTGVLIGVQEWEFVTQSWQGFPLALDLGPVNSVPSLTYLDVGGVEHTLDDALYYAQLRAYRSALVRLTGAFSVPSVELAEFDAIRVRVMVGYSECPVMLAHAVRLMVGHYYENREATVLQPGLAPSSAELPLAVGSILSHFRTRRS